jgi:hypothetical protein
MRLQLLAAWRRIGKAKAGTTISVAFLFAMGAEAQHRWHPLPQRSERKAQGMAYDPDRKVVVMYGGAAGGVLDGNGPEAMQQTWEWDGVRWHERRPKHSPGPRRGASMCFDPVARRILLFGGSSRAGPVQGDTWHWDGQDWVDVTPGGGPGPRMMASLAADPLRKRVVLFGGAQAKHFHYAMNDTWEWDGKYWWRMSPKTKPQVRSWGGMAFSRRTRRMVLFGGAIGVLWDSDHYTWEWDGNDWIKFDPAVRPDSSSPLGVRGTVMMCTDPFTGDVLIEQLLQQGAGFETWRWDGAAWTKVASNSSRKSGGPCGIAAHEAARQVVAFGGLGRVDKSQPVVLRDTWTFDGKSWRMADLWEGPGSHTVAGDLVAFGPLVEDPGRDRLIVSGGKNAQGQRRTWALEGQDWRELQPAQAPPSSLEALDGVALRHSGEVLQVYRNSSTGQLETWIWNGATWRQAGSQATPRFMLSVAYDSKRKRALGLGFSTLYEWPENGSSWRVVKTSSAPTLNNTFLAYDPSRDRLVAVSLNAVNHTQLELDEFDGASWVSRSQLVQPPFNDRRAFFLEYVPSLGGVLLHGGTNVAGYTPKSDSWLWDGKSWTQTSFGSAVLGSQLAVSAYDSARGRLVCGTYGYHTGESDYAELIEEELSASLEHPRPGESILLQYDSPAKQNGFLLHVWSLSQYPGIPLLSQPHYGPRVMPLDLDAFFLASLSGAMVSWVDGSGRSSLPVQIPLDPGLVGFEFHSAALHVQSSLTSTISNPVQISVIR